MKTTKYRCRHITRNLRSSKKCGCQCNPGNLQRVWVPIHFKKPPRKGCISRNLQKRDMFQDTSKKEAPLKGLPKGPRPADEGGVRGQAAGEPCLDPESEKGSFKGDTWRSRVVSKHSCTVYVIWCRVCGIYSVWYMVLEVQRSYNQAITVIRNHI